MIRKESNQLTSWCDSFWSFPNTVLCPGSWLFSVTSPNSKLMENNTCSNCNIQRRCSSTILRYVYESVTSGLLNFRQSCPLKLTQKAQPQIEVSSSKTESNSSDWRVTKSAQFTNCEQHLSTSFPMRKAVEPWNGCLWTGYASS